MLLCVGRVGVGEQAADSDRVFEVSARGGEIARGTADQRGRRFGLRHIAWLAAIELGLTREADRNRFILLELDRPPQEKFGRMNLPTEAQLADLGLKLLALAVAHVHAADRLAQKLKSHGVAGVPSRIVESYATPAALLAAIQGLYQLVQEKDVKIDSQAQQIRELEAIVAKVGKIEQRIAALESSQDELVVAKATLAQMLRERTGMAQVRLVPTSQ